MELRDSRRAIFCDRVRYFTVNYNIESLDAAHLARIARFPFERHGNVNICKIAPRFQTNDITVTIVRLCVDCCFSCATCQYMSQIFLTLRAEISDLSPPLFLAKRAKPLCQKYMLPIEFREQINFTARNLRAAKPLIPIEGDDWLPNTRSIPRLNR